MDLRTLKRHWDHFGRTDAFWAVLTLPGKRGGWTAGEFFQRGEDEVTYLLYHAHALGLDVSRRRALDFGCGVGRLTQALAGHFNRCDGVDIAKSMIAEARRHDRHPDRVRYHLNPRPDLSLFPEQAFTFVYSTLVLQHMPPELARGYLQEFLRVLAPGGLLVFQLPSHRTPEETPADVRRSPVRPLGEGGFRAAITLAELPPAFSAGAEHTLVATVKNLGSETWAAGSSQGGSGEIALANRWLAEDGCVVHADDGRSPLPYDVAPGTQVRLYLLVKAPKENGAYRLAVDMVQEDVAWFSQKGSVEVAVACRVEGGARDRPAIAMPPEAAPASAAPRFRDRHPNAHRLLKAAGFGAAYAATQRTLGALAVQRQALVERLRPRPQRGPVMQMHFVPQEEVEQLLASLGAVLLDVEKEVWPGGFHSRRYWVTRPRETGAARPDSTDPSVLKARLATTTSTLRSSPLAVLRVDLVATNEGDTLWLHEARESGGHVAAGGHLRDVSGAILNLDLFRAPLPRAVAPGDSASIPCSFVAPAEPGRYRVELDLVVEGIAWFGFRFSPTVTLDLEVV